MEHGYTRQGLGSFGDLSDTRPNPPERRSQGSALTGAHSVGRPVSEGAERETVCHHDGRGMVQE